MDFAELCDALGNSREWTYISCVIVAVWEVATDSSFLEPATLTRFVSPVAAAAGVDLLTPLAYRACLRKLLGERVVPLLRMLRDAHLTQTFEFEDGAGHASFDPVSQEHVTHGFRINGEGTTVLSLPNLLHWVLANGMRSPAGYGNIESLQRVCSFGVAFPPTPDMFLQHLLQCDTALAPAIAAVAATDSIAAAHASVKKVADDWGAQTDVERRNVSNRLTAFVDFWGLN